MTSARGWPSLGLAVLASAACARSARPDAPSPVMIDQPAAGSASAPENPAPTAQHDGERARLEAACFAQPWTPAEPPLGPKPMSAATRSRLDVLERECRDTHPELGPGRFATPGAIPPSECHYGIGRIYFEERRYIEAAHWFHRVATEDTDSDMGVFGAQLYLEALNVLWSRSEPKREACRELLVDDARSFACTFCGEPGAADACTVFRQVGEAAAPGRPGSCPP